MAERINDALAEPGAGFPQLGLSPRQEQTLFAPELPADSGKGVGEGRPWFAVPSGGAKGRAGAAAEAYAKDVVAADFQKPGDDDVVEKVAADFKAKGVKVTADDIRREMERLLPEAKRQIMAG